jgi:ribose 5-phosphate isomerase B
MVRYSASGTTWLPTDPFLGPMWLSSLAEVGRQIALRVGDPPPRHLVAVAPHRGPHVSGPGADKLCQVAIGGHSAAGDLIGREQDPLGQQIVHSRIVPQTSDHADLCPERRHRPRTPVSLFPGSERLRGVRVHLGCDHAGLELKDHLITWLRSSEHEPVDHGPEEFNPADDYPGFCIRAATGVAEDLAAGVAAAGVVIGGSGNGEQIAANKVSGIRCALVWSTETAQLAREHNDAQVISVGGRLHPLEDLLGFVDVFLNTPFGGEDRHCRRIGQIAEYERAGNLPSGRLSSDASPISGCLEDDPATPWRVSPSRR